MHTPNLTPAFSLPLHFQPREASRASREGVGDVVAGDAAVAGLLVAESSRHAGREIELPHRDSFNHPSMLSAAVRTWPAASGWGPGR